MERRKNEVRRQREMSNGSFLFTTLTDNPKPGRRPSRAINDPSDGLVQCSHDELPALPSNLGPYFRPRSFECPPLVKISQAVPISITDHTPLWPDTPEQKCLVQLA